MESMKITKISNRLMAYFLFFMILSGVSSCFLYIKLENKGISLLAMALVYIVLAAVYKYWVSILIDRPVEEAGEIIRRISVYDFSAQMSENGPSTFKVMAESVNEVQNRLLALQKITAQIAAGDISDLEQLKSVGKRSENDHFLPALITMMTVLQNLSKEVETLTQQTITDKQDYRSNIEEFKGTYKDILLGINELRNVLTAPVDEARQVFARMAVNDFTLGMTGSYSGKMNQMKEDINGLRERLLSIQDAFERVGRGDISKLEEFEKIGQRSKNDRLMPACISAMRSIHDLVTEASGLSKASITGDLSVRGDEERFAGGYVEIINGFNRTLDAVVRPIDEASAVMQEMARGNLTVSMEGDYQGDYAKIKTELNSTIKAFNDLLNNINITSQQVAAGAIQVSDSAQSLSHGSTEQASSIEELTASLEEISSQTRLNADNASQANDLAVAAKQGAMQGNEQMKEMLKAMNDINESSANISKIIKVIDDIAFQTNILALNAAVEAARAGQHGKGFAVVAEEVRNLAARSANAAKETTALIESSIKEAEEGTRIAGETAQALSGIVDEVSKVTTLVGEIATASNEQAAGIAQINQGIALVSQVIQTNSATSEESASASEELSSQAGVLKEMVGRFQLRRENVSSLEMEKIDPEVLKLLEGIVTQNNHRSDNEKEKEEPSSLKKKIVLSDKEFGKY